MVNAGLQVATYNAGAPNSEEYWMRLAIALARKGTPAPNPHVGAVVVRGGDLVGVGFHARAGLAHAEVAAIRRAGSLARGATLYVTLEPCNHFGRTPPCVDAILEAGITRVVVGTRDPNPHVSGGGLARLAAAGVEVVDNVQGAPARALIASWASTLGGRAPSRNG